jgi:hypothetical protein
MVFRKPVIETDGDSVEELRDFVYVLGTDVIAICDQVRLQARVMRMRGDRQQIRPGEWLTAGEDEGPRPRLQDLVDQAQTFFCRELIRMGDGGTLVAVSTSKVAGLCAYPVDGGEGIARVNERRDLRNRVQIEEATEHKPAQYAVHVHALG